MSDASLTLDDLVSSIEVREIRHPRADVLVRGVRLDSRRVRPGDLYVALPGTKAHGGRFAPGAVELGAVAVLTDAEGADLVGDLGVPVVVVDDPRGALADVSVRVSGHPSGELTMLGLTGTNGKTTTSFLVEAGLRAVGHHVGTIGTLGFRLDGEPVESDHSTVTTPEANDLQDVLATLRRGGADSVVMEVSSHALALQRVRGVDFDVVGFTNLGRDHLDFHRDLSDYFEAKARLFAPGVARHAVIVTGDDHARELAERVRAAGTPALTTVGGPEADVELTSVQPSDHGGNDLTLRGPWGERSFTIDLPGEYNARNAALALTMLTTLGHDVDAVISGLEHAQVPGRMQRVPLGEEAPTVFVDFAHTPQAIAEAVKVGDRFARTIVVVGAGGDRDNAKRGPMGQAAVEGADVVVVTDDNPRSEAPAAIREQVILGALHAQKQAPADSRASRAQIFDGEDRAHAIRLALDLATAEDVVLVLGKGHEQGQIVGDRVIPFDDAEVVARSWATKQAGGA